MQAFKMSQKKRILHVSINWFETNQSERNAMLMILSHAK